MKRSLLSLSLLASIATATAQPALVKDINPGSASSYPNHLTVFGKKLVFSAFDATNGFELWSMDSAGTTGLAYNINPGNSGSINMGYNSPFAVLGKYIYFPADNGTSGTELYKWDGSNPPSLAAEIYTGAGSSYITELVVMKGKIYFNAEDGINGSELWVYDTTSNSAMRLSNVNQFGTSVVSNLVAFKDKVYFSAWEPSTGIELYHYDPMTNNTTIVTDLEPGVDGSYPLNLVVIGDKLYFTAQTSASGREVYVYETSVARITDVNAGPASSVPFTQINSNLIAMLGGYIYFSGNDATTSGHLYKFDPANGVATLVYKVNATGDGEISNLVNYAGKLYFTANDGANGNEIWKFTGFGAPTMVADIYPGFDGSYAANFVLMNNSLYFSATDDINGTELYKLHDSTTGVQNVRFAADVKVYPNPTASEATLQMNLQQGATLQVKMVDMTGRTVYTIAATTYAVGETKLNLPMANLATGTYAYIISDENGKLMHSGRIQKQ